MLFYFRRVQLRVILTYENGSVVQKQNVLSLSAESELLLSEVFIIYCLLFIFYSLQFIFCCFRSVLHYLVDMYVVWTSYILLLFITYFLLFLLFDNYLCSILIVYCCVFYCMYHPTIFYFFFIFYFSHFIFSQGIEGGSCVLKVIWTTISKYGIYLCIQNTVQDKLALTHIKWNHFRCV